MSNKQKRFILPEDEIPRFWYNIQADMINKPLPPLNPATKEPLKPEDLYPIFAKELCQQELNQSHIEVFEINIKKFEQSGQVEKKQVFCLFDYSRRNPLNRAARTVEWEIL